MNDRVKQIRSEALVAEYVYSQKLHLLSIWTGCINALTIIIPVLFTSVLLLAKGTKAEPALNTVSVILSAVLLVLVILGLILKTDQKRENYLIGRRSNIFIGKEALKLINEKDEKLDWFYNYLVEIDSKDQENVESISDKLRKKAYRYSLEKLIPGRTDIVCPICKSSPFIYKAGSCQVCGNTPKE